MKGSKYIIFKKQIKDFALFPVFKVLNKNGSKYTLLGKSKKTARNPISIYEIDTNNFPANSWIELDNFVSKCTLVNRNFYRTKPIIKPSLSGGTYEDVCYTVQSNTNTLVAVYENLWLCMDYAVDLLYFLPQEYIDADLELCDVDQKIVWTKEKIKQTLVETVDSKVKNLYNNLEL